MPRNQEMPHSEIWFSHQARISGSSLQIFSLVLLLLVFLIINGVTFVVAVSSNVPLTDLHGLQNRIESRIFRKIELITKSTPVLSPVKLPLFISDATPPEFERHDSEYLNSVTPAAIISTSSDQSEDRYQLKTPLTKMKQVHEMGSKTLQYCLSKKSPVVSPGSHIKSQKASSQSGSSMPAPMHWSSESHHNSHVPPNSRSGSVYSVKSGGAKDDPLDSSLEVAGSDVTHLYDDILLKKPEFSSISNSPPSMRNPLLRVDSLTPFDSVSPNKKKVDIAKAFGDNSKVSGKFSIGDDIDFSSLGPVSQRTSQMPRLKRRPFSAPSTRFLSSNKNSELESRKTAKQ